MLKQNQISPNLILSSNMCRNPNCMTYLRECSGSFPKIAVKSILNTSIADFKTFLAVTSNHTALELILDDGLAGNLCNILGEVSKHQPVSLHLILKGWSDVSLKPACLP
jgi:hypothetical protein